MAADDGFPNCETLCNQLADAHLHTDDFAVKCYTRYFVTEFDGFKKYFTNQVKSLQNYYAKDMLKSVGHYVVAAVTGLNDFNNTLNADTAKKHKRDVDQMDLNGDISEISQLVSGGNNRDVIVEKLKMFCNNTVMKLWIMTAKTNRDMYRQFNLIGTRFPDYKVIEISNIHKALTKALKHVSISDANALDHSIQNLLREQVDRQFEDQIKEARGKLMAQYTEKEKFASVSESSIRRLDESKKMVEEKLAKARAIQKPSFVDSVGRRLNEEELIALALPRVKGYIELTNKLGQRVFELMFIENLELDSVSLHKKAENDES